MRESKKLLLLTRTLAGLARVRAGQRALCSQAPKIVKSPYQDIRLPEQNLHEFIWRNMDKWPDKTAVVCGITGKNYNYADLRETSHRVAQGLRGRLGLRRGDVIALMAPNIPDYCPAILGSIEAGIVPTTLNPIYTPEEIANQLRDSGAKAIITLAAFHRQVAEARKSLKGEQANMPWVTIKYLGGDATPEGALDFSELSSFSGPHIDLGRATVEDLVMMPYSSGTTGLPKGVLLTHSNITANLLQLQDKHTRLNLDTTSDWQDRFSAVLPFYHIYGLVLIFLNAISEGGQLITLPKFHPDSYHEMLKKNKPTLLYTAPPIVLYLNNHPSVTPEELSPVRRVVCGAAPLAPTDIARFNRKFPPPGDGTCRILQGFGLTEASPLTHVQTCRMDTSQGGVGSPIASTECRVVGLEDGKDRGVGESGELWVRGPQVMKGYHNNEEATAETVTKDGWLQTGDIAHYDESGQFHITDRLKELIKVKGFQVAPAELEGILRHHPELLDAAVTGVDHVTHGQAPKAFVIRRPDSTVTSTQLQEYVAEKVAPFKQLVGGIVFVDTIPKNPSGKILRRLLKNM